METLVALNIAPITTSHRDLDYLPLADKDFKIKDLDIDKDHLKLFFQCRDNYLNGYDTIGLGNQISQCTFSRLCTFSVTLSISFMPIMIPISKQ